MAPTTGVTESDDDPASKEGCDNNVIAEAELR